MDTYAPPRFYLVLVSLFAVLALVTTAVGLYGLLAHAVGQRQREIGVRVTLGATPRQVCGLVLREALAPVLVGIALGALATWWTTDLIASLLYGIGPRDPRALALAAAALVAVAVAAAIVPIRRATGVDPVYALRLE
jgi:ABC-type antimicrobial peptide transport system permease subunit